MSKKNDRQTVDFGIDLGTTNSAVARATSKGPKIVKIAKGLTQSDTIPSAVAHTSTGQTLVGEDALAKIDLAPATKFKRLMGTSNRLSIGKSEMLPEELSAEILKELKSSVRQRYDIELENVVITVPAMFQQPQCEATHRAAALAGLNAVTLLQEPIAAATAYLNDEPEEGDYLVYDLGGGTFDVSIVRLRDSQMSVIAHGGDNYLGGSDFDRSLVDWATNSLERRHGALPQLAGGVVQYRLQRACEEAKIRINEKDEIDIDLSDLELPIARLPLTRAILEDLIEEPVGRTIRMAKERIEQAGLTLGDITSILLIGGPTFMPYIRRRLKEELGIPLSLDQDPMTVVALGAAIHAGTLLVREDNAPALAASTETFSARLELHYEPVSPDLQTTLAGRILHPEGFNGEIRVARAKGDWETGWILLRNSAFVCDVMLESGATNDFTITLRDLSGRTFDAVPGSVTLRNGIAVATPVTPYHYGVALADGVFSPVIEHNTPLPTYGTVQRSAAKTIPAGSPEELIVYFLEGLSPIAKDNIKVGELRIQGTALTRTIREGERIEVRIHMDESRRIKARVTVPVFDLDFPVELNSMITSPDVEDLAASLREAEEEATRLQSIVKESDEGRYREIRHDLDILAADVERVKKGEIGEAERVASKLSDVKVLLHPLRTSYALLSAYQKTQVDMDDAARLASAFEDRMDEAIVRDLRADAEKCYRLEDESGLGAISERADIIYWKHYSKTRECWIGQVEYIRENRQFASDRMAYDEWVKRAHDCLERDDYEGVRLNSQQAMSYLPKEKAREDRFWDAGLR